MHDFDSVVVASGEGTIIVLPNQPSNGHSSTIIRDDTHNVIVVNAGGGDVIRLGGTPAHRRLLNSDGASLTVVYVGGVWYATAVLGSVA